MPRFEIETPQGRFEVEAPDEQTAIQALQSQMQPQKPAQAPESQQSQDLRSELSAMTQNPARGQYNALPAWQKPIVAANDVLNATVDGLTYGYGDKAVAAVRAPFTEKTYEEELAEQRRLTAGSLNRAGGAGTAAQIAGAVAGPMKLAGRGGTLAGRLGTSTMTGGKGLAARTGLMGVEGAGYGALHAAGHDQDIGTGALIGAAGGVGGNLLGEGISAGVSNIAGRFNPKQALPGVDDLKAAGSAAFKEAERAGVVFNSKGVGRLRQGIVDDLTARGFDPVNEPGVMPVLQRLEKMAGGNVTFEGLATLRKVASNGWRPGMKSNNDAIGDIIKRIDKLVDASVGDRSVVLMGKDTKAAANAIVKARNLWHRARKLETVEKAITRGEQNAAAQVSGDVGRTTMGQLKKTLQSEAQSRGFTPAEMKKLGSAAGYSPGQRVAHAVGGLMPRGRLLASIHGATALGTGGASIPLQAAGAAVGFGAQKTAEALARKSVNELVALIANGGVPPEVVQNTMQLLAKSKREALSRALMAISVNRSSGRNTPAHQQ